MLPCLFLECFLSGPISDGFSTSSIIRTRAHTTIATMSTPSGSGTPLGAIRAKEVAVELMANRDSFGVVGQPFAATTGRHAHAQDV